MSDLRAVEMHIATAFEILTFDGEVLVPRETLTETEIADAAEALTLAQNELASLSVGARGLLPGEAHGLAGDIVALVLEQIGTGLQQWKVDGGELCLQVAERIQQVFPDPRASLSPSRGDEWQKCPVCDGQGHLNKPPHVPGDQATWLSGTTASWPCKRCDGTGTIRRPDAVDRRLPSRDTRSAALEAPASSGERP